MLGCKMIEIDEAGRPLSETEFAEVFR